MRTKLVVCCFLLTKLFLLSFATNSFILAICLTATARPGKAAAFFVNKNSHKSYVYSSMNSQADLFYPSQRGNRKSLKYYFLLMEPRMCSEVLCILCNVMMWWCSGYQIMRPSWWSAECHSSNNTNNTNSSISSFLRFTN